MLFYHVASFHRRMLQVSLNRNDLVFVSVIFVDTPTCLCYTYACLARCQSRSLVHFVN